LEETVELFFGVFQREFSMSIKRLSLWLAHGLLMILYLTHLLLPPDVFGRMPTAQNAITYAGTFVYMLLLFMPVVGGILIADRLVRDQKLGVDEMIRSTPLKRWQYLAGKYFGALTSILAPVLLTALAMGAIVVIKGGSVLILPGMLIACLSIALPAYILITAFSLACPLVMPVRVYQVLFTGYWFWGNYLSPHAIPTLNGTVLCANGEFVVMTFLGGFYGMGGPDTAPAPDVVAAVGNVAILCVLAGLALFSADLLLARRVERI
jgi:hypothetical protein